MEKKSKSGKKSKKPAIHSPRKSHFKGEGARKDSGSGSAATRQSASSSSKVPGTNKSKLTVGDPKGKRKSHHVHETRRISDHRDSDPHVRRINAVDSQNEQNLRENVKKSERDKFLDRIKQNSLRNSDGQIVGVGGGARLSLKDGKIRSSSGVNKGGIFKLPSKLRAVIWKKLKNQDQLNIRRTCKDFMLDIENYVGIYARQDERFPRIMKWYATVGIKALKIFHLNREIYFFLIRPNLLQKLIVRGQVSRKNLQTIFEYCKNLVTFEIYFTKKMILKKYPLFIQPMYVRRRSSYREKEMVKVKSLKTLRFEVITKKKKADLKFIEANYRGLLKNILAESKIKRIYISLKTSCEALKNFDLDTLYFVYKNAETLQEVFIQILIEKKLMNDTEILEPMDDQLATSKSTMSRISSTTSGSSSAASISNKSSKANKSSSSISIDNLDKDLSRDEAVFIDKSDSFLLEKSTEKNENDQNHLGKFQPPENKSGFPAIEKFHLAINGQYLNHWNNVLEKLTKLKILELEIRLKNNWIIYQKMINFNCKTLVIVNLFQLNNEDSKEKSIDLDMNIFVNCVQLRSLTIDYKQNPLITNPKITNISKLPKSLRNLKISWLNLSTSQVRNLCAKCRHLEALFISYWTMSDEMMAKAFSSLRWLFSFKLTKLEYFVMVESKIRFQFAKKQLDNFKKHLPKKYKFDYIEGNENTLFVKHINNDKNKERADWISKL